MFIDRRRGNKVSRASAATRTATTLVYRTRCEDGTAAKLMMCAGTHSFQPVWMVSNNFDCAPTHKLIIFMLMQA